MQYVGNTQIEILEVKAIAFQMKKTLGENTDQTLQTRRARQRNRGKMKQEKRLDVMPTNREAQLRNTKKSVCRSGSSHARS